MNIITLILIAIVALEHLYILYIEMFAWETKGKKFFKSLPEEIFPKTKTMAANQGLYNGFLAAGLLWSLCISDVVWQFNVALFFLGCVIVAALYGTLSTKSPKILIAQGSPAILALICLFFLK